MCKVASNLMILTKQNQLVIIKIIKSVQTKYFGEEVVLLSKQKKLEANYRFFKLESYVDAQYTLKVGGRTQKSLIQQGIQHPVLLPKD